MTVLLAELVSQYLWGTEVIPILLLGMTIAIAYQQEMALLLAASVTLVIAISIGLEMQQALVLMATVAGAILVLKQVRTRGKLISVGAVAAGVALFTTVGVGTLHSQPHLQLWIQGLQLALWSVIAGPLMLGLLPAVERVFNVQTDLSLIELGDPAHPLLQELDSPCAGHVQPLDHRRLARRSGRRIDRCPRPASARGGLLPRHRQDAQAGLLRRESSAGR